MKMKSSVQTDQQVVQQELWEFGRRKKKVSVEDS